MQVMVLVEILNGLIDVINQNARKLIILFKRSAPWLLITEPLGVMPIRKN